MPRNRMAQLLASAFLATQLMTPSPAFGHTQNVDGGSIQSCSEAYVNIWEHYGFNGRGLHICYGVNIPDLAAYGFDNITSSAEFDELSRNTSVCLYSELNYIGEIWKATSDSSVQWVFPPNDWASSVKFGC